MIVIFFFPLFGFLFAGAASGFTVLFRAVGKALFRRFFL